MLALGLTMMLCRDAIVEVRNRQKDRKEKKRKRKNGDAAGLEEDERRRNRRAFVGRGGWRALMPSTSAGQTQGHRRDIVRRIPSLPSAGGLLGSSGAGPGRWERPSYNSTVAHRHNLTELGYGRGPMRKMPTPPPAYESPSSGGVSVEECVGNDIDDPQVGEMERYWRTIDEGGPPMYGETDPSGAQERRRIEY